MANYIKPKLRPLVKTHGGKYYLARWIIKLLPAHRVYVEPFAGGLSVLLNKRRARVEVASDLNGRLIDLYGVLCDRSAEFINRVLPIVYDSVTFDLAAVPGLDEAQLGAMVRFLVRNRMSRNGLGEDFSWSGRTRGGRPGDLNAWETIKRELPRIAERLSGVELRCQDALELIRELDGPDTLFYLDPPYLLETRAAKRVYAHEMSDAQHAQLLDTITRCRGMVVLSGYPSRLYDEALTDWMRVERKMPNHSGQGKTKQPRIEVLWFNRQCLTRRTHQAFLSWAE
jgi:DNA adenine methylase